ncbi:MAG: ShlB/FhaC/HecB family hemolysin secretion/activation protein [Verrucomicrobiia bacterium]
MLTQTCGILQVGVNAASFHFSAASGRGLTAPGFPGRANGQLWRTRWPWAGLACLATWLGGLAAMGATAGEPAADTGRDAEATGRIERHFFIKEFRVEGARRLPRLAVEKAVYPFLGPYRTLEDVEKARTALERAFQERGYQTVGVVVLPQRVEGGVIAMKVVEGKVGRLRVKGSRYFDLDQVKEEVPSLAEGNVPEFERLSQELAGVNRWPDRRVTPSLVEGREFGTVDAIMNVKDTFPLHGSVEVNNRYSPDTTSLRVNTALSYQNLWQLGHTVGLSYQISPQDFNQVQSFSAYYLVPVPEVNWLSVMLLGSKQNSTVSTLGTVNTLGAGESLGARAMLALPGRKGFYHSSSLGFDYRYTSQDTQLGSVTDTGLRTSVTYFPWNASYSATWLGNNNATEFNGGVTFHARGMGSDTARFDARRHGADANFIYFRGDLSHTRDLPEGFQYFVKAQWQIADRPLISNEQFSGGGLDTARGYLESVVTGDNAIFGTMEVRSPSFGGWLWKQINEWRAFAFTDAGRLALKNPLPEEISHFDMASWGVGTRIRFEDHFNGALTLGIPMVRNPQFKGPEKLLTFRLWCDF